MDLGSCQDKPAQLQLHVYELRLAIRLLCDTHSLKMSSTIILITGGNRGLGEGLVKRFLEKPNHVIHPFQCNHARPTSWTRK
jgi:hypothetical protein